MFIESADISQFRNLEYIHLDFSSGFNIFYGDNAQGKSNLLEALYTLAFLKGFRADHLETMIKFDQPSAQLSAIINHQNAHTRLSLELFPKMRRAYVDGSPCTLIRQYLGILRAVLFVPSDVSFLQAAPTVRRTMLDRMVFNLKPAYLLDLDAYQKITKQKSAVLREDTPDPLLLDTYDEQLKPLGARILKARFDYFSQISPYISHVFAAIFDENFICIPQYKCSCMRNEILIGHPGSPSADSLIEAWNNYLTASREREMQRHQISAGPHRDDWSIVLNGHSAKQFASQGQQRALCLAIKLAEIECMRQEADMEPVFLLDDVSSELDPERSRKLFRHLNDITVQTFLTTTSKSHINIDNAGAVFQVKAGTVEHES